MITKPIIHTHRVTKGIDEIIEEYRDLKKMKTRQQFYDYLLGRWASEELEYTYRIKDE